jgi:hypothetical protein
MDLLHSSVQLQQSQCHICNKFNVFNEYEILTVAAIAMILTNILNDCKMSVAMVASCFNLVL